MPKRRTVPAVLADHLPTGDAHADAEELVDGRWIVAGRHALILVGPSGVEDSGMWYEVQFARWDGETHTLSVVWVDPARRGFTVRTLTDDAEAFMAGVTEKVRHSLVVQKSVVVPSGTRVTASVRRAADGGLFSTLVADGPLDEAGTRLADELERDVREGVGLDA